MAKNNKYTSINFNHIYEKTINNTTASNTASKSTNPSSLSPSPSSFSASYSAVSAPNKPHGRILVLTRPTPKPVNPPLPSPSKQPQPQQHQAPPPNPIQTVPDQTRSEQGSDSISLRPLGRTGAGPVLSGPTFAAHEKDKADLPAPPLISPKPDKFVPPHLRPGYVPREEAPPPGPDVCRARDAGHRRMGHVGPPGQYLEDGRPKSGGYERIRRGGGPDMGRPRSSGSRPNSSG